MSGIFFQNSVYLSGITGDDVKFGKAANGKEYCTFLLEVNHNGKMMGDEQTSGVELIRVAIFNNKRKLVDYLKEMGFRRGMRVNIVGRLQSTKTEYKGIELIQLMVQVIDITIVQTKPIK